MSRYPRPRRLFCNCGRSVVFDSLENSLSLRVTVRLLSKASPRLALLGKSSWWGLREKIMDWEGVKENKEDHVDGAMAG